MSASLRLPASASRAVLAAAILLLAACAQRGPAPVAPDAALHPRSVAIIPVLPSEYLTLERRSLLAGGIERLDRYAKQKEFEKRFAADRAAVADALTASLLAAAQRRGYDAVVLTDIVRIADDPEEFDYARIGGDADIVVHVRLRDIGVFNPLTSLDYEPNVDTKVLLVARRTGFEVVNENFHYGVNATRQAFWAVPSDPRDRWPHFDAVIAQTAAVEKSWLKGADALGARIIEQLPAPRAR